MHLCFLACVSTALLVAATGSNCWICASCTVPVHGGDFFKPDVQLWWTSNGTVVSCTHVATASNLVFPLSTFLAVAFYRVRAAHGLWTWE